MANKFQLGGQVKEQDAVMQFVKALAQTLQADPQLVIQAALLNPEALKSAVQVYLETLGDIQKAAQAFSQALQSKAQAAKHGAKLNYLKSLKNKCAEDEELYYFKKGGSVGCGCKKKAQGREMKDEKKDSPVKRFKMARGGQTPEKKNLVNPTDTVMVKGKPYSLVNTDGSRITNLYPAYAGKVEEEDRKRAKAGDKDALKRLEKRDSMEADKCGGKMKKESCGGVTKFKADKCGGKMKKHQNGGSLNGVPFIRKENQ